MVASTSSKVAAKVSAMSSSTRPDDVTLVLFDERLVETHLALEVVDLLLAGARAHRHARGIAGHDARDHEDHDREPEQNEQRPERSPDQKVQELQLTFSFSRRCGL
jgi:hypothetical protein